MQNILSNFEHNISVVVIGATGGVGAAFIDACAQSDKVKNIYALSRHKPSSLPHKTHWVEIDITNEESVQSAATHIKNDPIDIIITATGILHAGERSPERSLRDINLENFEKTFLVNTHGPALVMKHFLPLLNREKKSVFASLSARVGSISDNNLGGWYAYRASKSALNMLTKTASIEVARRNKLASIITLHPGTVNTNLSKPFQANVPDNKLFTPEFSALSLLKVIDEIDVTQTGKCFDWQGEEVLP